MGISESLVHYDWRINSVEWRFDLKHFLSGHNLLYSPSSKKSSPYLIHHLRVLSLFVDGSANTPQFFVKARVGGGCLVCLTGGSAGFQFLHIKSADETRMVHTNAQ